MTSSLKVMTDATIFRRPSWIPQMWSPGWSPGLAPYLNQISMVCSTSVSNLVLLDECERFFSLRALTRRPYLGPCRHRQHISLSRECLILRINAVLRCKELRSSTPRVLLGRMRINPKEPVTEVNLRLSFYMYLIPLSKYSCVFRYLYCDEISLEADTALPTLYAAKKYIMPHLAQLCVEYLETKVDASNACLLLRYSRLFGETGLMKRCLHIIDTQAHDALQSDNINGIDYQTLEQILGRDNLRADETVVFKSAVCWAEAECTRQGRDTSPQQCRDVLGDALYLLRFPIMTPNDFADGARQSGLLNQQEIIDILLYFTTKENDPKLRFSTISRMPRTPQCCRRYLKFGTAWRYSALKENVKFSVNKAISVAGFGLYNCYDSDSEHRTDITLKHNGVALRQTRHNITYIDGDSGETVHVLFDSPLRIEPNICYTVTLAVPDYPEGYYHYVGKSGPLHVTCGDLNFTFSDFENAGNRTSVDKGHIPEILFDRWSHHLGYLNIKMSPYQYSNPHVKDRLSCDRIIFNMGNPYLERKFF